MIKKCRKCNEELSVSEFYRRTHGKFGVAAICKKCNVKQVQGWREKNKVWWYLKRNKARRQVYHSNQGYRNDILLKSKKWWVINTERRYIYQRRRRWKFRIQVLIHLGGKCARCGFDDWRTLQIDHVNGDGYLEDKTIRNNEMGYLKRVIADTSGKYQLLCANCNWIKRDEKNEVMSPEYVQEIKKELGLISYKLPTKERKEQP